MNLEDILLEPEQQSLLKSLVAAHNSLQREQRQDFQFSPAYIRSGSRPRAYWEESIDKGTTVLHKGITYSRKEEIPWNLDHDLVFHPGLPQGSIDTVQSDVDALNLNDLIHFKGKDLFLITPKGFAYSRQSEPLESSKILQRLQADTLKDTPIEIRESITRFKIDHPNDGKVAFVMMRFGKTSAHDNIIAGIKQTLDPLGITTIRADDKQYHDDLFPNVLTYVHGCGFGIAVFERIETEEFNPNVALEVGYMFALKKQVCLLKDKNLKTLHADLVGKLYRVFDPLNPVETIPGELSRWLRDKGLA